MLASHRFAVTLLLPSPVAPHICRRSERRIPALKEHPPERSSALPVLIVSLSYCSAVSVLLNPRLVDLEHLVANKAARRISLVKLLCATSCPVFPFCWIGNPRFGTRKRVAIGDRRSMFVSLAFKSIQRPSRLPRSQ